MHQVPPVPDETLRVTRAAFPKGNVCMRIREVLDSVGGDARFESLFGWRGHQAEAPWRLVVVMLLQFAEGLSDRQAAEAVRSRIDWKYLLSLDLADPGFNVALLSHFTANVGAGTVEQCFLEELLAAYRVSGLPNAPRRRSPSTTQLLTEFRFVNRLERIAETFREALRAIVVAAPEWIGEQAPLEWQARYGPLSSPLLPPGRIARRAFIETLRADGQYLLDALHTPTSPSGLADLEVLQALERLWAREFATRDGRTTLRRVTASAVDADDAHGVSSASLRARAGRLRWDLRVSGLASAQTCVPRSKARQRRGAPA